MAVSGLLFLGANAAWNGLGYLNPLAWFLEWSSVVLAFLCVYASVRTTELKNYTYGYALITVSLLIAAISYILSVTAPQVSNAISQSINPYYFLVLGVPLFLIPFLVKLDLRKLDNSKFVPFIFILLVMVSLTFLLFMFSSVSPPFPTDESVFDMYAAHLFLSGLNPYNPALMANAFNYYHFRFQAFDPITPLTTGGYVNSLTYPALSFLVFIPAVLLKLKASTVMLPFLIAPVVIVWYRAWSRKKWLHSAYAILPFIALITYVYQGGSADTDALWATLLMLSYFVLPRYKTSGLLFGLSLSVKQFPILVFPFLAFFLYKEYGIRKMLLWTLLAGGAFIAVNGYFISKGPDYWISSMLANEFAPLIGIGFGIPQLSFSGIFNIPAIYFTIAMIDLLIAFFLLYVIKYRELKYALFAFPIIIFLFDYRLFSQYLFYWMLLSILPMLDLMLFEKPSGTGNRQVVSSKSHRLKIKNNRIITSIFVFVIVASMAIGYHEVVQKNPGYFVISSVKISSMNATGYADVIALSVAFYGNSGQSPVYFRIFNNGPIINGNMLQWTTMTDIFLENGKIYNLTIFPEYQAYSINPKNGFMVVAYYGDAQGAFYFSETHTGRVPIKSGSL